MGAESSSLQAIESLNSTLSGIEKKLGVIEDVHLHHERTICHDNVAIVSGKQIKCYPDVQLTVGPVVGLISQTSVRILVETNANVELTFHFFLFDELHTDSRFVFQSSLDCKANMPNAKTFDGLMPDKKYVVYIGGCSTQCALLKYASFRTLPRSESTESPRVLFSHSGRVDRVVPGEVNLWQEVQKRVMITNSADSSAASAAAAAAAATKSGNNSGVVHMVFHLGNFLDVDALIRSRVIELLDLFTRDDAKIEGWELLMHETEECVRDAYRTAFNTPEIAILLRSCGHIFLAGDGEAGMLTASLLGMAKSVIPVNEKEEKMEEEEDASPSSRKKKSKKKGAVLGFREAKRKAAAEEAARAKEEQERNRAPLKRGEEHPDSIPVDTETDLGVPAVGGATRRTRESAQGDVDGRSAVLDELRRLLLGAVVRMVRRVSWTYMRQAWDPDFELLMQEEGVVESNQRAVMVHRKRLQMQQLLQTKLEGSLKKIVKEFGEEYRASQDIKERFDAVTVQVNKAQVALRESLDASAKLTTSVREPPNGMCTDLGGVVLVLLESAWGWLGRDGLAQQLYNRDVSIHSSISTDLDTLTFEGRGTDTPSGDEVRTVLCVSTVQLLPASAQAPTLAADEPQSFRFASVDSGKLLRTLALWQQRGPERATLIGAPCTSFAASGWASPIVEEEDDDADGGGGNDVEGWNGDRSRLRMLLVNRLDKQSKAKGEARHASSEGTAPLEALQDTSAGFQAHYDRGSSVARKSYWEAESYPATKASRAPDGGWILGKDAGFHLCPHSDKRADVTVTVGPVIGRVGPTSAIVLLEAAQDAHVELLCVDQVTGVEYSHAQLVRRRTPAYFSFDDLVPNRSYDIRVAVPTDYERRSNDSKGATAAEPPSMLVRGSFTTANVDVSPDKEQANKARAGLRAAADAADAPPSGGGGGGGGDGDVALSAGGDNGVVLPSAMIAGTDKDGSGNKKSGVALRAFVVGANKPSWLRTLPHQDPEETDDSALGADRVHLANGLSLLGSLTDVTSRALSPVSLVIHCGYSVDLSACINTVVKALVRAEEAALHHGSSSPALTQKALSAAYEALKSAYALHWGGSSTRKLLAHGSHLVVSNPMLDMLSALNSPTLRQLGRDLSSFCSKHLLQMLTRLDSEYQLSLWDGGVVLPNSDGHARERFRAHFFGGGSVAVMPMRLRSLFAQDSYGTTEDGLLSEFFFDSLSSLLGLSTSMGSPVNNQEYLVDTLVLVSPLPLIHDDPALVEGTFVGSAVRGMSYSPSETLRLLDMVSEWAEEVPGREIVIVTGGVDVGHCTNIYCQLLDDPVDGEESEQPHADGALGAGVEVLNDDSAQPPASISEEEESVAVKSASTKEQPAPAPLIPSLGGGKGGGFGFGGMFGGAKKKEESHSSEKRRVSHRSSIKRNGSFQSQSSSLPSSERRRQSTMVSIDNNINVIGQLTQGDPDSHAGPREPIVVCVRQVCVGPLVGVPGDDLPEVEGELYSTQRRFSYVHEYFERDVHCGLVEVWDNRFVQSESDYHGATAEVLDFRTISDVQDAVGPAVVPDTAISLDMDVLKDSTVCLLWKHTNAHLKGGRKKKADVPQNNDAIALSDAVTDALDSEEALAAYPVVHRTIIKEGALTLPLRGGWAVEDILSVAARHLLLRMPPHDRAVCPMPSSLVLRLIWSKLETAERKLQNKSREKSAREKDDSAPADPRAMITAAIVADAGYLAFVLRQAIEAQALLEHFSVVLGVE